MKTIEELRAMSQDDLLIYHEGKRDTAYLDKYGYVTIGIGCNISSVPLTNDEIMFLYYNRLNAAVDDLQELFPNWNKLSQVRQNAIVDMRFNLGPSRFRSFHNFIAAITKEDFKAATEAMLNSLWYIELPVRVKELMLMIEKG